MFPTINFNALCNYLRRLRAFSLSSYSHFFVQAAASKMRVSICRFKQLYLGKHSELDTCLYELSLSQWPILSPRKIFDLSSWITRYKFYWHKIWSSYNGLYWDNDVKKCDAMCLCVWVCQLPLSSGRKSTLSLILGGSSMVLVLVCQTVCG